MKTFKNITILATLLLVTAGLTFGQLSTLTKTYLTNAVASTDTVWVVTSTTGMSAPTAGQNGTQIYIEGETARVAEVIAATQVRVTRTQRPVAHSAAATLFFGLPIQFHATDPIGRCTLAAQNASPWINTVAGRIWTCDSSLSEWNTSDKISNVITETRAAPGTTRAIRGEFILGASLTSGNPVGVRGAVTMAAASSVTGGYIYGAQGKVVTGTGTFAGTSLAGLYGQLDVSGGTISAGHVAAIQANIYGANSGTIPMEGIYVEHAGGGVINSFFQAFGKSTYVFDLSSNTHVQMSSTCTPGAVTGGTGGLKILVDGAVRYIPLAATCSGI